MSEALRAPLIHLPLIVSTDGFHGIGGELFETFGHRLWVNFLPVGCIGLGLRRLPIPCKTVAIDWGIGQAVILIIRWATIGKGLERNGLLKNKGLASGRGRQRRHFCNGFTGELFGNLGGGP